ncbi:MAG: hypothetical protein ABIR39_11675 [Nocardioides sp.]|uniref:hypothetical protein n=1 Tax=Nocardioides sp. TaxID=35761 RepID=UPI003263AE6A
MNAEDLRSLAERASDVEGRRVDRLAEVHARIRTARRRRAAAASGGAAVLVLAAVVGVSVLSGSSERSQEPVEPPTPTPSETFELPAGEVTYTPDIAPDDIHGWDTLATRTNTQTELLGATDLSTSVTVSGVGNMHWEVTPYCLGDPDTWYRLTYADGGFEASRCGPGAQVPVAPRYPFIVPASSDMFIEGPQEEPVRMIVTRPTQAWVDCFTSGKGGCKADVSPLRPLESTDVEFGFVVFQHPVSPTVLEVFDQDFEALAMTATGEELLVARAVVSAADASTLVVPLDPSEQVRVVGVYQTGTPRLDECREQADTEGLLDDPRGVPRSAYSELDRQCMPQLALRVDGERVELDNTSHGLFGVTGSLVPPGARELTVDVVKNDPRNGRFALVLWQARPTE